ncbi:MAG: hypothetical protein Q9170_006713 [Blastenia crenularia]
MIRELLLALSGHPSPLLIDKPGAETKSTVHDLLSPAEQTLLTTLSQDLGQKHSSIRRKADEVVASHSSTICRAVCSSILSKHLAQFQQKILDVEKDTLDDNPSIVGANNIVPLSTVVRAFNGWERKLDWLWRFVSKISDENHKDVSTTRKGKLCTASDHLKYLRDATYTGYPDLEELSLDLVAVAETAWLKQLTSWVLYGKLPSIGATDFFIYQSNQSGDDSEAKHVYSIRSDLVPPFVEPDTANSILFIGRSLHYLRLQGTSGGSSDSLGHGPSISELQRRHLMELSSVTFPISPSRFTIAIRSIRLSLSKNALQKLLPLAKLYETLRLVRRFFLLEHGEFALALISAADERMAEKQSSAMDTYKLKGSNTLKHVMIKEGEVNSILPRAWGTLVSIQPLDEEESNEDLELAQELMELSLLSKAQLHRRADDNASSYLPDTFQDLLLPTATVLTIRITSPLDLFLTSVEVATYSRIHAYLLAIRRAHLHLTKLMTLSALRNDSHSSSSSSTSRSRTFNHQRDRMSERFRRMRPVWALIGSATFFLAEFGAYLQGEVIQGSWNEFQGWFSPQATSSSRPQSREAVLPGASLKTSVGSSRSLPDAAASTSGNANQNEEITRDPEMFMIAHQRFLKSLCQKLLLNDTIFSNCLRTFMTDVDHLCALMGRLSVVQQNVDFEEELGPAEKPSGTQAEETRLVDDLESARTKLDTGVTTMVSLLREADSARTGTASAYGMKGMRDDEFVPRMRNRLDRLLLKLDYTSPRTMALHSKGASSLQLPD